jgi:hypothetical protein
MSYKLQLFCRKFSLLMLFMLLLQVGFSQYNFTKVDNWLSDNLKDIGGRVVLVIYKDGKLVYTKAENELSSRQKRIGKFIAKRQGKDADEMMLLRIPAYSAALRGWIAKTNTLLF